MKKGLRKHGPTAKTEARETVSVQETDKEYF